MAEITQGEAVEPASKRKTMPFKYFVMHAAIWFLVSGALGLSQVEGATVLYLQTTLLAAATVTLFAGVIMDSGWKTGLITILAALIVVSVVYLWRDIRLASAMDILAWMFSMFYAIFLFIHSWAAGGVEWQILKDSSVPALVIVLAFTYFYLAYERDGRLGPLTSSVIWFVASTAWLGSAVIAGRRLL